MIGFRFENPEIYNLTDPVLRETPLADCNFAMLFAYMHRRFGQPFIPGDDYKDLSASWIITTPDPDLALLVRPSLSGAWNSFVLMARHGVKQPRPGEARYAEYEHAYRIALLDLLRPVNVRDQSFNAMGKLDDDDDLISYDENRDEADYAVPFHPSCGWAMPQGLFGNDAWQKLCMHLRDLGDGDLLAGRDAFLRDRNSHAIRQLRNERNEIVPAIVVAMLSWTDKHQDLIKEIDLDPARIEEGRALFSGIQASDADALGQLGKTDEAQDACAACISKYLNTFDHPIPTILKERIDAARMNLLLQGKWEQMLEACNGKLPRIDCLNAWEINEKQEISELRAMPDRFRQAGYDRLAGFAEELISDKQGMTIFSYLVMRAKSETEKGADVPDSAPGI